MGREVRKGFTKRKHSKRKVQDEQMFSIRWGFRQHEKEKSTEAWTCTARLKSRGPMTGSG